MKTSTFLFTMAAAVAAVVTVQPVQAAKTDAKADAKAEKEEAAAAKKGVRLVVCSASGEMLPSSLYVRKGMKFAEVGLSTRSLTAPLAVDEKGTISFWKEDPSSALAGKGKDKLKEADIEAELPKPDYVLADVPSGSKMVGIVMPNQGKLKGLFFKETAFPASGVHLINLSPYPLQMMTSAKGDFNDTKTSNLAPYKGGIGSDNSFSVSGADGETISFAIAYKAQGMKAFKRFKMSTMAVSSRQSQITVVLKDPAKEQPKLVSFQITEPSK